MSGSNDFYHPLKYARVEAERRFLLGAFPREMNPEDSFHRIIDHYLVGTRLRLRRIETPSGKTLVYKFGQKYQANTRKATQTIMTNFYLTEAEYAVLAALESLPLTKRRYPYHFAKTKYAIDVFEGNLEGLILAEIEDHSDKDIVSLPVPPFADQEVTEDPLFTGGELSKLTRQEFQRWLDSW